MFRLESVSPLVVAWAVSLGLGGVLLALFFSGDPAPQHVAVPTPAPVDRTREAPADQAGSEPVRPGQDFAPVEQPVVKVVRPAAAAAKKVIPDNKPIGVVEPLPQPGPTEPPGPRVATKPKQPLPPTAPKATPAPRPASKIEAALKLPIMRYVHQKPVTVLVVIREIEQLGGAGRERFAVGMRLLREAKQAAVDAGAKTGD